HQVAHFVHRKRDARSLQHPRDGPVADLPVRCVLALEQRVDHRVLEVCPPPPRDERVRIAVPALLPEVTGGGFREPALHVHHGPVLVEHAHLDGSRELGRARHRRVSDGCIRYPAMMPPYFTTKRCQAAVAASCAASISAAPSTCTSRRSSTTT